MISNEQWSADLAEQVQSPNKAFALKLGMSPKLAYPEAEPQDGGPRLEVRQEDGFVVVIITDAGRAARRDDTISPELWQISTNEMVQAGIDAGFVNPKFKLQCSNALAEQPGIEKGAYEENSDLHVVRRDSMYNLYIIPKDCQTFVAAEHHPLTQTEREQLNTTFSIFAAGIAGVALFTWWKLYGENWVLRGFKKPVMRTVSSRRAPPKEMANQYYARKRKEEEQSRQIRQSIEDKKAREQAEKDAEERAKQEAKAAHDEEFGRPTGPDWEGQLLRQPDGARKLAEAHAARDRKLRNQ